MAQEFTVLDMTCSGCASSVRKAVLQVPGVEAVDVDLAQKNVRVEAPENVTTEQIMQAINEAGYIEVTPGASAPESNRSSIALLPPGTDFGSGGCS